MVYARIEFEGQDEILSLLRNGTVRTVGVVVSDFGEHEVMFNPVNSRGIGATGHVSIHVDAIPDVMKALAEIYLRRRPADEAFLRDRVEAGIGLADPKLPEADVDALGDDETAGPRL